jgi:NAD(P)-dependent dehydrogenase (short-subunit alcohol dehydrogenase family)
MTAPPSPEQTPIGSGISATSTAADVLAGIDLTGRFAVVTGGYSGIGLETTRALVGAGASVAVPARRPDLAAEQLAGLERTEVDAMDLTDLASVAAYADRFLASGRGVDMLIDSAGVMAAPETRVGRGWELQLAANHLGHFALVNRLRPALAKGSRVVSVSSRGHHFSGIRWEDPMFERDGYDKWLAYGQSKTANVLFAVHLDALAQGSGIRAFALHPGTIHTNLGRHLDATDMAAIGVSADEEGKPIVAWKTPEQGAATQVWAATSPQLDAMGGVYLEDCEVARLAPVDSDPGVRIGVKEWAIDPDQAARLWAWSAELTGVDAFG